MSVRDATIGRIFCGEGWAPSLLLSPVVQEKPRAVPCNQLNSQLLGGETVTLLQAHLDLAALKVTLALEKFAE